MNNVIEYLSYSIPALATICNVYLLFTLITAKKTNAVKTIMLLLGAFIFWTLGSTFTRMIVFPGVIFWWKISLTGLFLVPYFYFLVTCSFVNKERTISKIIYGILTLAIVILNFKDLFLTVPSFKLVDGIEVISYSVTKLAFIPVIIALTILTNSFILLFSEIKNNNLKFKYIKPFLMGILVMIIGVLLDLIPLFNALPMDTLACAINAIFIYKAFSMRRLYPKYQLTSTGGMFVISVIITALLASPIYNFIHGIILKEKDSKITSVNLTVIIILAAISIVLFIILNKMNEKLFIKDRNRKEILIKKFSKQVSKSLNENEIIGSFYDCIRDEIKFEHLYILKYDLIKENYVTYNFLSNLENNLEISSKNPIFDYLTKTHKSALYEDFLRSIDYRGMWESEKNLFNKINATYFLPFFDNEKIIVLAIFSKNKEDKPFSFDDIDYMDSIASIGAIGLKNASLYTSLEKEAQNDSLTELYNRRTFIRKFDSLILENINPLTLIMLDIDDLFLYNELYGTNEGDELLKRFASILKSNFDKSAIISRYEGKEFAILLPFIDSYKALEIVNSIKNQIKHSINNNDEKIGKFLTFSGGICTYPSTCSTKKDMITNVTKVISHIKLMGKNDCKIYNDDFIEECSNISEDESYLKLNSFILTVTEMIDQKDHYTFNHSRAVSHYASSLAKLAGYNNEFVETISRIGLLHDIGKNGIPEAILTKQGKLTNEEYAIMKKHPEYGKDIIRRFPGTEYLIPGVYSHHERYDGRGYPRGLKGEEIPIEGRILAIADSFDAMVSKRSYKDKMPIEKALEQITECSGTQFDPKLGELFVDKIKSKEIEIMDYSS